MDISQAQTDQLIERLRSAFELRDGELFCVHPFSTI